MNISHVPPSTAFMCFQVYGVTHKRPAGDPKDLWEENMFAGNVPIQSSEKGRSDCELINIQVIEKKGIKF